MRQLKGINGLRKCYLKRKIGKRKNNSTNRPPKWESNRRIHHIGQPTGEIARSGVAEARQHIFIKGNNDQAIVANHFGRERPPVSPELIWLRGQLIARRPLVAGKKYELTGKIFWVVTCGDLTRGLLRVWTPKENTIG